MPAKTPEGRVVTLTFPVDFHGDAGLEPYMLVAPKRATIDRGFPDERGVYRCAYLKVPFTHPDDGWERSPRHDTRQRVYCVYQPDEALRLRALGTLKVLSVWPVKAAGVWHWRVELTREVPRA